MRYGWEPYRIALLRAPVLQFEAFSAFLDSLVKQPKDYKDMYVLSGYDVTTPEGVAPAPDPTEE